MALMKLSAGLERSIKEKEEINEKYNNIILLDYITKEKEENNMCFISIKKPLG